MKNHLKFIGEINLTELTHRLRELEFRGAHLIDGSLAKPYTHAKFSLAKVYPPKQFGESPTIQVGNKKSTLFSPQPTIYLNQLEIVETVDNFLRTKKKRAHKLNGAVYYEWKDRGEFHMIPPIVEKHTYDLTDGYIDFKKLLRKFQNLYVKDAKGNFHKLTDRYLKNFYIDEVSAIRELDIFHNNSHLINYGAGINGKVDFYIVCDGMHRISYALENLNEPINVILVEPGQRSLIPYYAFPMPFVASIRLSSKQAEKMYNRLERDKIHLFSDFLKKTLHYDWTKSHLNVSRLRSNI